MVYVLLESLSHFWADLLSLSCVGGLGQLVTVVSLWSNSG